MMDDVSLQLLVKEAKESILPLSDEREQYADLARWRNNAAPNQHAEMPPQIEKKRVSS